MMSQARHTAGAETRSRLDEFLKRHFGDSLSRPKLGPIAIREEFTTDYDNAECFAVNTVKAIETGNIADGLLSGAIVVPKDGSPVHWAPTRLPIAEYLEKVATGETWWSTGGADPITEVRYYGLLPPGRTRNNPAGVMRRRTAAGRTIDEMFTRNLTWKPTDYFRKYDSGHHEDDHVEITAAEAAELVRRIRTRLAQQQ